MTKRSRTSPGKQIHCHVQVAAVAKEATSELYETLMGDNLMYETWRKQHPGTSDKRLRQLFVDRNWPRCIPFARATLARLLTTPIDEKVKESIMEVLVKDASLVRGRVTQADLMPMLKGLN